jgi:hypothetical protein
MASNLMGTFDPKQVTFSHNGINFSGFADGTFIKVARVDKELYKMHVGAHGEPTRTKNNNTTGTVTVTLKQTSPSNVYCDGIKLSTATGPIMVKNNSSGKETTIASEAWINEDPDRTFSDKEGMVEWVFMCSDVNTFTVTV